MCSLEFNDLAWAHDVFPYLLRNSDPGILSGMNRFPVQCSCRHSCTADSTMPSGNIDPCSLPDIHISCRDCTIRCSRTFCYIRDRGLHTNSVRNVRVIIMVSGFCCFFQLFFCIENYYFIFWCPIWIIYVLPVIFCLVWILILYDIQVSLEFTRSAINNNKIKNAEIYDIWVTEQ